MAPTETEKRLALDTALQEISDWLRPGTNEGANFLMTRLRDPLTDGSLFGGADLSQWFPHGARGILRSQGGAAFTLDFSLATPALLPLDAEVDLNTGAVNLTWKTSTGVQTASFTLSLVEIDSAHASYFFGTDTTSDTAAYAFTVVLL
jgi:hypothetical protein